ncbi:hypothetical protein HAZT_HAZT001770 [Hyalella azteca]|uniref:K Homology domain-containing protein n=1 Tax=Hyalella azteca TaxID=294128 RepID=A0A6A0HFC2_HYAAZ|nr:hypothetical protein HAZT_HAZT001770 [Hyalella azteca]
MDDTTGPDAKRIANNDGSPVFMGLAGNGPPMGGMGRPNMGPPGVGGGSEQEEISVPDKMSSVAVENKLHAYNVKVVPRFRWHRIVKADQSDFVPYLALGGDAIARARDLIFEIVNKGDGPERRRRDMGPPTGPPGLEGNGGAMVEISIPGPKVGLIIGKNGETIKGLQEKSGAKMVIIQDGPQQEDEKPLRITGEQHKVEMAKQLVYDLIAEKETQAAQFGGRRGGRGGFRGDRNDRGGGRDRDRDDFGEDRQLMTPHRMGDLVVAVEAVEALTGVVVAQWAAVGALGPAVLVAHQVWAQADLAALWAEEDQWDLVDQEDPVARLE